LLSSAGYYSFTRRHFLICGFSKQLKSGTTKTPKRQCRKQTKKLANLLSNQRTLKSVEKIKVHFGEIKILKTSIS
jgi:hypothetical protein